ncbi:sugar efflux transporter [Deinococcus maricopensis]|uniref:Major facilitator superfamily MFS_1 n=1 Tax=Deinococcus maricopensis (strain DSM 21211 / LMG 22137 / NRRL B-23946 / LB-34) TaxID=709986 RepID=E8U5S2_DEIML|nr:sugar efflux transporter [Deinococcus maricopensis]ADV66411.1 major facilitator superfamily MFS_1 [Deinococcus maricopensis DSM 21211]
MTSTSLVALRGLPDFTRLSVAVFALGLATSFAGPYISLFGRQAAHMTPLALGVFMTLMSLSSIMISTQLGRWSDRRASRRPTVLLALLAAATGYALLANTTAYLPLVLIACVFLGTGAAAFPQLFAFARAQISSAPASTAEHGLTTLRSVFSLAWVVGPVVSAAVLTRTNFTALFLTTGACFLLGALLVGTTRTRAHAKPVAPSATVTGDAAPAPRTMRLIALSFVLYGTAMAMGSIMLPLHVTETLHGTPGQVGFLVGLCALLEIPVMLSFVLLPRRFSYERLILFAFALFAVYFVLVATAPGVGLLIVAQAVRAVVLAITASLGMAYFQQLMPNRIGTATTLFANTTSAGSMIAGVVSGACAQVFGYQAVFVLCAALSAAAFALLLALTRRAR